MPRQEKLSIEKIIAASIEIIDVKGYNALTLADVAKVLKIKPPSLYNHISGLDALRQQMGHYAMTAFYDAMTTSAFGKSGSEAIYAVSDAYMQFVKERTSLYQSMTRVPNESEPAYAALNQKLTSMLTQLMAHYAESESDRIHCVRGLRSLLYGFAAIELEGGFRMAVSKSESFQYILDLYIKGLESNCQSRKLENNH
ncbi:TetR/AcrR family transcriptional regulator [Fusibacter paucivorans]|uniref:TetR/AcrR family transcriptional regulator n=1 Tax=Fusibacter paucivorans TaxID=76009 RepID=A0ABS5PNX1_9FIRM|nr:TetR/AcrR family transcriptional regulator [Fusibacter paucivorans]MBS7526869.1 TetR/AcrR family transcriptional regulator [Fusibacter paucivorans]